MLCYTPAGFPDCNMFYCYGNLFNWDRFTVISGEYFLCICSKNEIYQPYLVAKKMAEKKIQSRLKSFINLHGFANTVLK